MSDALAPELLDLLRLQLVPGVGPRLGAALLVRSGLARGSDPAAHRGRLEAGGRTLGVRAGGLARVYPPEHKDLAGEVERAGALVSESRMGQEPLAALFPARNRIISGLSQAVV